MLHSFLSGAITAGFLIGALFFLRFWKTTQDDLFIFFACAFALLGISQAILALPDVPVEERSWIYLIRFAAFSLILGGIAWKNRAT
jgi:uncharacterized membrane protein HdeD (DUF308 family)